MASTTPRKGIQGMVEMGAPANPYSHFLITPKKRKLEKESSLEAHPYELQREQLESTPVKKPITSENYVPSFFEGTGKGIFFVGENGQDIWIKDKVRDFFFLTEASKPIWLRISVNTKLTFIMKFLIKFWSKEGVSLNTPIVTLNGSEIVPTLDVSIMSYLDHSTFIICDQDIPEMVRKHSGKLFHCVVCCGGYRNKKNFDNHCKKGDHRLFLEDSIPTSWGRTDNDRGDRAKDPTHFHLYGLPKGHRSLKHTPVQPLPSISSPMKSTPPSSPATLTKEICQQCLDASHACRVCNQIRCTQYHLMTDDEKKFICSVCEPSVRGVMGTVSRKLPLNNKKQDQLVEKKGLQERSMRNVKRQNYKEDKLDDDISSEESDSDMEKNLEEEGSEEESLKARPKIKIKRKYLFEKDSTGTDEEDGDTDDIREKRHQFVKDLSGEILSIYRNPPAHYHIFKPDEEDYRIIAKYVISPALQRSTKVTHLGEDMPHHIKEAQKEGKLPMGQLSKDFKYWSETGRIYYYRIMELLGLIQNHIYNLNPNHLDRLPHLKLVSSPDGGQERRKLCLSQFLNFKQVDWLELLDIRDMIEEFELMPSKMSQLVSAYDHLCTGVINFLHSAEGSNVFLTNQVGREKDMDIVEFKLYSSAQKQNEILKITNLATLIKSNKFYERMRGKAANLAKKKLHNLEEFGGQEIPDPNVVSDCWVSHPDTQEMNRLLVQFAGSQEVVSKTMLSKITEHVILNEAVKNGFRQQIFSVLDYKDFLDGINNNFAAYPYAPLHKTKGVDPGKIDANLWKGPGGEVVYQRPDPYSPDPNDPLDPMLMEPEKWELMRGKVLKVDFHKTANEPQLIWLSQYGVFYFKCYEQIRAKFLESIDEDASKFDRPFFINTQGGHFIRREGNLDMTTFCKRVGIQWQSSHVCRKMMVRKVFNSNNAILKEYEQAALCHLQNTAEDSYLGNLSKKVKSLTVTAWYREQIQRNEEMVTNATEYDEAWFSMAQGDRFKEGLRKMTEQELMMWLNGWEKKDSCIKATPSRIITPNDRVAMVRMVKYATLQDYFVSNEGTPAQLLLDGRAVRTPKHTSLILRMLELLPKEWSCVKTLKTNLLEFAGFQADRAPPVRDLMVMWANKFIEIFHKMKTKSTHIANPIICYELSDLAINLGGGYMLGNDNIQRQLSFWIGLAKQKAANASGELKVIAPEKVFYQLEV